MRRIVFLINSLAGGGAERAMARLIAASAARRDEWDMHLALLDREEDRYDLPPWLEVHRLNARGSLQRSLAASMRLLPQLKPDVCLSFLTRANLCNVAASALTGHRSVISERAHTSNHHKGAAGAVARHLVRASYPRASAAIAVSGGVADDLVETFGLKRVRVRTVFNAVDIAAIKASAAAHATPPFAATPYVVAMGRFVPSKNFALLLNAFQKARFTGGLLLLGDGPLRAELASQVRESGLDARVRMPGFLDNPFPLIAAARALVLPSNGEGFPNTLCEAMALGVPVISTNCLAGPSEILAGKVHLDISGMHVAPHGVLTPLGDAVAMAQAIDWITADTNREQMAARARARAEDYSPAIIHGQYWQVIESALANGH